MLNAMHMLVAAKHRYQLSRKYQSLQARRTPAKMLISKAGV